MKAKTIYISGKISGAVNGNRPKFMRAECYIRWTLKHRPINPHALPANHDKSWISYMKECIKALMHADEVYVLDDWKESRGAIREVLIANWLHIPVYDENGDTIKITFWLMVKLLLNRI